MYRGQTMIEFQIGDTKLGDLPIMFVCIKNMGWVKSYPKEIGIEISTKSWMYEVWKKEIRDTPSGQIEGATPGYRAVREAASVLQVYFGRLQHEILGQQMLLSGTIQLG